MNLIRLDARVTATSTGLQLPVGFEFNEWQKIGNELQQAEKAVLWWIGDWLNYGERAYGEMYAQSLDETDYSLQTLQNAKWVASRIECSRRLEHLSWNVHQEVASLPPDQQDEILAEAVRDSLTVRDVRQRVHLLKRGQLLSVDPPRGRYKTVVIDPPWPMEKIQREIAPNQVVMDYPTMSLEKLAEFELPLADEAHAYVWTTQRFLPATFQLLETWGLTYIFTMVWHKPGGFQPFNLPQYNCEFVLFGRKGGLEFEDTKQFFTAFSAPRREHSRKPDEFYDLVRRVSPAPRIDMFSREPRDGFKQFGNEQGKFAA